MAIAPITGGLRKKIITDITVGFGIGFAMATAYWEFEHKPIVKKRDEYYRKLKLEKEAEESI